MSELPPVHRERLTAPLSWWLLGIALAVAVFWAFLVATPLVAAVIAGVVTLALVVSGLVRYGSAVVATEPDGFQAGPALLPYGCVGDVTVLDRDATRRWLGVDADARAYLLIRPYCPTSVRVMVADPDDPAPYWLVSTRHPRHLAASLAAHAVRDWT